MAAIEEIDLLSFCDPIATRFDLGKPWRSDNGKAYATDGCIVVALDDGSAFAEPTGRVPQMIESDILASLDREADYIQCPVPTPGKPEGSDAWWNTGEVCDACEGVCYETCDLGHEHRCRVCRGDGRINGEQWDDIYDGDDIRLPVNIDGMMLCPRRLWCVSQLPGVRIRVRHELERLDFVFDGGCGCLMCKNPTT